jgi:hypothetical protein
MVALDPKKELEQRVGQGRVQETMVYNKKYPELINTSTLHFLCMIADSPCFFFYYHILYISLSLFVE